MDNLIEKYLRHFEILELETNASLADIAAAYKKLKDLYSSESIVTDPLEDEFSREERLEIVNQLDEAYKVLVNFVVEKDRSEKESAKIEEEMADTAKEEIPLAEEVMAPPEEVLPPPENLDQLEIPPQEEELFVLEEKVRELNFNGQDEMATVLVHENEHEHEHIHIELPVKETPEDQDIEFRTDAFEIISTDVKEYESKDLKLVEEPDQKDLWEENLFKKDIKTIKEEITRDIHEELTISKSASAIEPPVIDGLEGILIRGNSLRKAREKLGLGIHEIAVATKINYKILVNIEKERFSKLPEPGYLRWYLLTYAKALSLDPKRVADEYMAFFRRWKRDQEGLM